jgi:hypothetical protein
MMGKVLKIKRIYEDIWLGLDKVTAVGTGMTKDGRPALIISLSSDDQATKDIFPAQVEGIPIEFRISGEPEAF